MQFQIAQESRHQRLGQPRLISHLECHNPAEIGRRKSDDVREISVEGKQNRVQFLCFGNDEGILGFNGKIVSEPTYFMTGILKGFDNGIGNTVIREEPQTSTSNSLNARA